MSYLTEAFKQMELLEGEQFTFDKNGAAKLANFLDDDMLNDFEVIIDPEAETKEEVKDSYMGEVICRCPICKSLIYKNPEEIIVDKEIQLANIEEECPFCFEAGGYEIIGQVAPYEEISIESESPVEVKVNGQDVKVKDEDEDDKEDRDNAEDEDDDSLEENLSSNKNSGLKEDLSNMEKLYKAYPELKDEAPAKSRRHTRDNEDIEDSQRFPVEGTKQIDLKENENNSLSKNEKDSESSKFLGVKFRPRRHTRDNEDIEDSQRYPIKSPAPAQTGLREDIDDTLKDILSNTLRMFVKQINTELTKQNINYEISSKKGYILVITSPDISKVDDIITKMAEKNDWKAIINSQGNTHQYRFAPSMSMTESNNLKESMEDISITTDDQVIKIKATPREDKETIQPVEAETKEKIEASTEEESIPEEEVTEETVELDELDEESFDNLGESYLKEVYENVNSFKTSSIKNQNNQMIIEGTISFNSGKRAKTKFIFEASEMVKNGKLKFLGLNENLTKSKKAFTLTGSIVNKKLVLESLNYNYSTKDGNGKPKRLYGTVKIKK